MERCRLGCWFRAINIPLVHSKGIIFTWIFNLIIAGGSSVTDSPACSSSSTQLSGCTDSTSLTSDPSKFNFQFLKCYSPYINSISHTNGTTYDIINFTGDGFGSTVSSSYLTDTLTLLKAWPMHNVLFLIWYEMKFPWHVFYTLLFM